MFRKLSVCLLAVLLAGCMPPRLDPTMVSAPNAQATADAKAAG
ncbi:hypothetical protein [Lysobacter sp. BMK333-48F3]|nr:hypothetical protein [Lysobacter sp. BMK333-48F3]